MSTLCWCPYQWRAGRVEGQGFLGGAESLRCGGGLVRRRWRLAHWQRRSDHLIVPGTSLGRRGRSKRAHYVDRLGAVGHWAWSERQHLFTGVRQL